MNRGAAWALSAAKSYFYTYVGCTRLWAFVLSPEDLFTSLSSRRHSLSEFLGLSHSRARGPE
jgi:hypothetical protein